MGSSNSTSSGGGGGNDKKDKKTKTVTGTTKPGTSGGFKAVEGSSNLKQAVKPSTPKSKSKKVSGMGPGQSLAMSGTTGLASATTQQAETIKRTTGKSFNAISKNIGEVGSKYRRPADVDKYAKDLATQEVGEMLGGKKFTGPDGVERMSYVGTGMKDEQGRTILSKQTPELKATAPTLKQLGGDISRAITGYNTLEYIDGSNTPTMVRKKGLIEASPAGAVFNAIRGTSFFKNDSSNNTTKAPIEQSESNIRENERKRKLERALAGYGIGNVSNNERPFLTVKGRGFGGTFK